MPKILQEGYEKTVRAKFGVSELELPDEDINDPFILDMAEAAVIERVPNYDTIDDAVHKLKIQAAVIAYICFLLAPSMPRRLDIEVGTMDMRWKKDKVDWGKMAEKFLAEFYDLVGEDAGFSSQIFRVAPARVE